MPAAAVETFVSVFEFAAVVAENPAGPDQLYESTEPVPVVKLAVNIMEFVEQYED